MIGKFVPGKKAEVDRLDWGNMKWLSRPSTCKAKNLVVIEVLLRPGGGHNFHKHPGQEEVIYVVEGAVEQWLGTQKRVMKVGDSVFIGAGQVHASFNVFKKNARVIAILGPCKGRAGYGLVDVSNGKPWNALRKRK
ncbi:MAG: cupin domain-containing protein [Planctomycetes bacterium]|nr:cupin domain-containing protein [Planctomycetota bacterium]